MKKNVNYKCISYMCEYIYVCVCMCMCVYISSLHYFDMIKDKNMVYLKLTFTAIIHDIYLTKGNLLIVRPFTAIIYDMHLTKGNLLIVRPLNILPCYLTVASG